MIAEIGFYFLILAVLVSSLQIYAGFTHKIKLAEIASTLSFTCVAASFCALMWVFATTDLSVFLVVENSHSLKPWLYKVTGTWGNHEGSMLLWILILTLMGAIIAVFDKRLTDTFKSNVLGFQACLTLGFLAFSILTSNPFTRIFPTPLDGDGLNPLLQDPGLAFHPPLLYIGYVGFSIVFAFALAALNTDEIHKNWASWVRPWTLIAWTGLSAGIALGSWWAYYELGWGGWWFWDPVENVALVPWFTGTALIHCALVMEKRGSLPGWTLFLAIMTFAASMLGTFLVRSGLLTSVHSFASDPARGLFILGLCAFFIGFAFVLFALKYPKQKEDVYFTPISRDGFLILNNLFMVTLAITVFVGTIYPLILEMVNAKSANVGAPYFNAVFLPLALPGLLFMGLAPLIPWKKADRKHVMRAVTKIFIPLAIISLSLVIFYTPNRFWEVIGIFIGLWLIIASFFILIDAKRIGAIKLDRWAVSCAHFGVGLLVFGTLSTFVWTSEKTYLLSPEQEVSLNNYAFTFDEASQDTIYNYLSNTATLEVRKNDDFITYLNPEKRFYPVSGQTTTEAAIYLDIWGDIYAVLGDVTQDLGDTRVIKVIIHPFVGLLWIGFGFIVLGGILATINRAKDL